MLPSLAPSAMIARRIGARRDMAGIEDLEARLAAVEATLELLQVSLSYSMTTQRMTIVDGNGTERVILSATGDTGSVLVRLDGPAGHTTGVELYATSFDGHGEVGLCLMRDGQVVSRWREG